MPTTDESISVSLEKVLATVTTGNRAKTKEAWREFAERYPDAPETIAWSVKQVADSEGVEAAKLRLESLTDDQAREPLVKVCIAGLADREGRIDEAVRLMEEALEAAPSHPLVLDGAARALLKAGQRERAREVLRQWVASRPFDPIGYEATAKEMWQRRAVGELTRFVNEAPLVYMSTYFHSMMLWRLAMNGEDTQGIIDQARAASQRAPESPKAASALAFSLYRVGAYDDAEKEARAALQLDPSYRSAKTTLARIAAKRGSPEDLEANPMPYTYDDRPATDDLNAFEEAVDGIHSQDWDENIAAFRELEEHGKTASVRTGAMKTTLGRLIHKRDREGVERVHSGLLKADPECPACFVAGWALEFFWGDGNKALEIIREGVKRFPASVKLQTRLMQTLSRSSAKGAFVRMAYEFLRNPPATPGECASVSVALIGSKRVDLAKRFVTSVCRKFPDEEWPKKQRKRYEDFAREHESDRKLRRLAGGWLLRLSDRLLLMGSD